MAAGVEPATITQKQPHHLWMSQLGCSLAKKKLADLEGQEDCVNLDLARFHDKVIINC